MMQNLLTYPFAELENLTQKLRPIPKKRLSLTRVAERATFYKPYKFYNHDVSSKCKRQVFILENEQKAHCAFANKSFLKRVRERLFFKKVFPAISHKLETVFFYSSSSGGTIRRGSP